MISVYPNKYVKHDIWCLALKVLHKSQLCLLVQWLLVPQYMVFVGIRELCGLILTSGPPQQMWWHAFKCGVENR